MATDGLIYVSVEEAIALHILLMREWDETRFGVDRRELLESALSRPQNESLYGNSDIVSQAATLCFGLIKNHPWLGGNKRTATYITEVFLEINGFHLVATDDEIVDLVLQIEADQMKVPLVKKWLSGRVVGKSKGGFGRKTL